MHGKHQFSKRPSALFLRIPGLLLTSEECARVVFRPGLAKAFEVRCEVVIAHRLVFEFEFFPNVIATKENAIEMLTSEVDVIDVTDLSESVCNNACDVVRVNALVAQNGREFSVRSHALCIRERFHTL
ncbi:hypothetical protein BMI91_19470 [Thioclava sediminum]|uniref:Uncharacterized protein n=1 Tax=Thioclava sediminum TaxID=1915319 RepID=A0ABX3MS68_9RHOB|nr:hypothetical protein BMI91_19470 [Thioclava sediminum]